MRERGSAVEFFKKVSLFFDYRKWAKWRKVGAVRLDQCDISLMVEEGMSKRQSEQELNQ